MKGIEDKLSHQFQARKRAQQKDQYQEGYKQEVLEVMQQPSEETQYKQLFKQSLLAQLGISDEKDSSKEAKKLKQKKFLLKSSSSKKHLKRKSSVWPK
ncbi:hypothetical protein MUB16_03545 [Priestia sp. OVL9]|nr:hypothetical protein [Priestia sp. OVL9]